LGPANVFKPKTVKGASFPFPSSKRFTNGKGNSTFLETSSLPLYISAKDIGFFKINTSGEAPPTVTSQWRRRRSKSEMGLEGPVSRK
jgi:hypothetical protein